jgi:hypothetical protein
MANFAELVEETKLALQDAGDISEERVKLRINESYQQITDETEIPALKKMTTVTTVLAQAWLNMPEGFSGRLRYVGDSNGKVNIASGGLEGLVEMYPLLDTVGDVTDVALQGTLLYYQGIPSTVQDLVVLYYEDVNVLEADDDTPDYLPEYLHIRLLSNHAAWQEYSKIEDGIEGIQVNVVKYKNLYEEAKGQFQEWLARRRNHTHRSVWDK